MSHPFGNPSAPDSAVAIGFSTHTGLNRVQNEDCGHADSWLLIVADGMGGHEAGEVASEITVSTIRNACTPAPIGSDETNLAHPHLSDLVKAVVDANSSIIRASLEDPAKQGMGTTVTALSVIIDPTDPDTPCPDPTNVAGGYTNNVFNMVEAGQSSTGLYRASTI